MNWLKISALGNSKVVKSMMIWMFITPIFAKALYSVESVKLPFFETDQSITLSLPFSWQVFFFCALSFTLANIIFQLKCPSLISKFNNFTDFKSKEDSCYLMVNYFNEHISEKTVRENFVQIGAIVARYTPAKDIAEEWTSDDTSNVNWRKGIDSLKHSQLDNMPDLFSALRIELAKLYPNWTIFCGIFYLIGFIGISIVAIQNIIYVYAQMKL